MPRTSCPARSPRPPTRPTSPAADATAEGDNGVPSSPRGDWHLTEAPVTPPEEMINTLGTAHQYLWTDQLEFSLNPY